MASILTILALIIMLGVCILIHELGHLLFAKKYGVLCHEFAIGMGPKLFSKKFGETEYSIRALPIGGFVSMAGEGTDDDNVPADRKLNNKPKLQYAMILFAGALFNFILGVVLLFSIFMINGVSTNSNQIDVVDNSIAAEIGVADGSKIVAVNGESIESYSEFSSVWGEGLEAGSVAITFDSNGELIEYESNDVDTDFRIGVMPEFTRNFVTIAKETGKTFYEFSTLVVKSFISIFTDFSETVDNVSGPVGMYTVVETGMSAGFITMMLITAFLTINLGILNLMPFPALDGSKILIAIGEKIVGKDVPLKVQYIISAVGLIVLMSFMLYITILDIGKIGG